MTLDTAVVGAGVVSETHLSGILHNPRTTLAAVCDLDRERAREAALKYDTKAYFDLSEMLEAEQLDWLHICTPVQTHADIAVEALEAGVPVLIEKPVTETVEEFERIADAARETGVTVSVVHNHVFDPVMRRAREKIEAGELGRIRGVNLMYTGSTEPDVPNRGAWNFELLGGEFEEGLPHPLYLLLRAGGYPESREGIAAQSTLIGSYDKPFGYDVAQVSYVSRDGPLCSATMLSGTVPVRILYVHGEDKTLGVDIVSQTLVELDRDYKASPVARAQNNVDQAVDRVRGNVENAMSIVRGRFEGGWESAKESNSAFYQYDEDAAAILTDDEPAVPLEEARWTITLMEEIRESAATATRQREEPAAMD